MPQALFNYSSMEDPKFLLCWDLKNLRPFPEIENMKKFSVYLG